MNADRIVLVAVLLCAFAGAAIPATDIRRDRHAEELRFKDCYVPCIERAKK